MVILRETGSVVAPAQTALTSGIDKLILDHDYEDMADKINPLDPEQLIPQAFVVAATGTGLLHPKPSNSEIIGKQLDDAVNSL